MKIIDMIHDLAAYVKERKDHPVLFPIVVIWAVVHWDIFYALFCSEMDFFGIVAYVELSIGNAAKNTAAIGMIAGYLWAVPFVKMASDIYNDALEMVKIYFDKKRERFDSEKLKLQNLNIEERQRQSIANQKENDIKLYQSIINSFDEREVMRFININRRIQTEFIRNSNEGLKQIKLLHMAISAPSNTHYTRVLRDYQRRVISSASELVAQLSESNIEDAYDDDTGEQFYAIHIKEKEQFYKQLDDFWAAYREYSECIKDLSM